MKIIKSLLLVIVVLPLFISIAASYIAESKDFNLEKEYAPLVLVSYKLGSEPTIMILVGFGLIGIAGIGRRKFITKGNDEKRPISLASTRPPFPEPVPWKKDT
jgi:hypothetical protein